MTLAQLQSRLARFLGLQTTADDPAYATWSVDALNDAQDEIATELQVPRSTTTIVAGGPVPIPAGMQSWGIIAAVDQTNGNPLAIFDPQARMAKFPSPPATNIPVGLEYDIGAGTLTPFPTPPTPINLELYYALIPTPMVNPTDVPLLGQYPEFHIVIALRAALLVHEADWGDPKRVQWVYQRFVAEMQRFRNRVINERHTKPTSEGEISGFTGTP